MYIISYLIWVSISIGNRPLLYLREVAIRSHQLSHCDLRSIITNQIRRSATVQKFSDRGITKIDILIIENFILRLQNFVLLVLILMMGYIHVLLAKLDIINIKIHLKSAKNAQKIQPLGEEALKVSKNANVSGTIIDRKIDTSKKAII